MVVGEVLNRFLGDESVGLPDTTSYMSTCIYNFCMYMLNCCSLFFFFRYLHKGMLYMFSAFTG